MKYIAIILWKEMLIMNIRTITPALSPFFPFKKRDNAQSWCSFAWWLNLHSTNNIPLPHYSFVFSVILSNERAAYHSNNNNPNIIHLCLLLHTCKQLISNQDCVVILFCLKEAETNGPANCSIKDELFWSRRGSPDVAGKRICLFAV